MFIQKKKFFQKKLPIYIQFKTLNNKQNFLKNKKSQPAKLSQSHLSCVQNFLLTVSIILNLFTGNQILTIHILLSPHIASLSNLHLTQRHRLFLPLGLLSFNGILKKKIFSYIIRFQNPTFYFLFFLKRNMINTKNTNKQKETKITNYTGIEREISYMQNFTVKRLLFITISNRSVEIIQRINFFNIK